MGTEATDIKTRVDQESGTIVNYRKNSKWYDDSAITEDRLDGDIFGKIDGEYHKKTILKETFLKIGTIYELRQTNGYYEGQEISLLGYYQSGDKNPVIYRFTVANFASLVDDGGAIIKTDRGSWIAQFNGVVDARDYGCSPSLTDNSAKFNKLIENSNTNEISVRGLNLKFTDSIVINKRIKIVGLMRNTIFDFTGLGSGNYALRLCTTAAINGFRMEGGVVTGVTTANLIRVNENNNGSFALTDSVFDDLRFENFNTGLQSNYMWCNKFINCRWQGCIEPLVLNAQSNNTKFDGCTFGSFKKALKMTNCEGILFSSCNFTDFNIANETSPNATQSFMSLSQSNVVIINPYWEKLYNGVLAVGGSSEAADAKSSLNVIGGKATDANIRIKINGLDTKISLKGLNNKAGKDIYVLENADNTLAPYNYVRELYLDNKQYSDGNTIAKFDGNQPWKFTNYGGSASNVVSVNKGYKTVQINGPVNTGFRVTNNLVAGEYYTLIYMINKNVATGDLRIHHGTDYQTLKIQNLNDNYEMRFVPFKAFATNIDMASTVIGDTFDIRYIVIVKGNYLPDSFEKIDTPQSYVIPTSIGEFVDGDIVKNTTSGNTFYTLESGTWTTLKLMKQATAVADVSTVDPAATYNADTQQLLLELKNKVNSILSTSRTAGQRLP